MSNMLFVQTQNKNIQIEWVVLATSQNAPSNWTKKNFNILRKEMVPIQI